MSNTTVKHTPGPWSATEWADGFRIVTDNREHDYVAAIHGKDQPRSGWVKEATANAKLIAAAPELLEALQKMLDFYWEGYSDPKKTMEQYAKEHPNSATAIALAAIKKTIS
jgi:hypothetical protein